MTDTLQGIKFCTDGTHFQLNYKTSYELCGQDCDAGEPAKIIRAKNGNIVIDAMSGNKSARDWVTKHVFSETEPQQSGIATTSREIIREAHEALKPLGYKPTELKDKIRDLCKDKIYTSADDLIQDIIRGA